MDHDNPCGSCSRSYAQMTEDEIKLDRYSKFRSLGRFEEFPVIGGQWQQARAEREQVRVTPRDFPLPAPCPAASALFLPCSCSVFCAQ